MKIIPYACLNIDCSYQTWFKALRTALWTQQSSASLDAAVVSWFAHLGEPLVTLSVRTGLDLYLQAKSFPLGSEVLMTAINIPEVTKILRLHGLIPVPVDLDLDTLTTTQDRVRNGLSSRTVLILVAHVFGTKNSLDGIAEVAEEAGLPIFEDLAEGYAGVSFEGDRRAEVTVFSFGPIKHATAFGGAVSIVRNNPELVYKMRRLHSQYPEQARSAYLNKVLKYSVGILLLNTKAVNSFVRPVFNAFHFDYKKKVVALMRGFAPSDNFLQKFRLRPSAALLSFLHYRLTTFDEEHFKAAMMNVHLGTQILEGNGLSVPGSKSLNRSYWLYPVIAPDVSQAYEALNSSGIDAYRGVSQLDMVEPPEGSRYTDPENVRRMFKSLLYLPLHKDVPVFEIEKIARLTSSLLKPKL
jgi:dTDP-4-amino-4,6-dideoxygalactose transaminase